MDTLFNIERLRKSLEPHLPRSAIVDEFTKAMMKMKEFTLTTHAVFTVTVMKTFIVY